MVSDEEFRAVVALDGEVRYAYFVKRVADWREAWGLDDGTGWLTGQDDDGRLLMPLWPARRYADACRAEEWADGASRVIVFDQLLDQLLPGLSSEGHLVSVFPVPGKSKSWHPDPSRLRNDLLAEYSKMHDDRA
jgi:hypothetical protein